MAVGTQTGANRGTPCFAPHGKIDCDRWVENPYFQHFCGEEFFQHALVFDRSSLTRWRQRMGEEKLKALLQESLAVATRTDAMKPSDLARVVIDTTVQPKAVMFPTDAKLLNRARERHEAKRLSIVDEQHHAAVARGTASLLLGEEQCCTAAARRAWKSTAVAGTVWERPALVPRAQSRKSPPRPQRAALLRRR